MKIQEALKQAMSDIASRGIAKALTAKLGGAQVRYRGIEDAMNEMSPILVKNGITVTPSYSDLSITERARGEPSEGKSMRFAIVKGSFTFSADDGSSVVCTCYGEAMDTGDKAVTKAQSVSFRTALFQQFVIPTSATAIDPEDGGDEEGVDDSSAIELWVGRVKAADTADDVSKLWSEAAKEVRQHRGDAKAVHAAIKAEVIAKLGALKKAEASEGASA